MRHFFTVLFIFLLSLNSSLAGIAILKPYRSEGATVGGGRLDCELLSKLILEETNRYRASRGRGALVAFRPLMKAAQDHSQAMADNDFFTHTNPQDRSQRTLSDRIRRVNLRPQAYAENIALTYSQDFREMLAWDKKNRESRSPAFPKHTYRTLAQSVTQQWINSRGHRENMLGKSYTFIGFGFASARDARGFERIYCVETFCSPELVSKTVTKTSGDPIH